MEPAPPAPPPKRTEWGAILLLILAVGGSAIGVLVYQHLQGGEKTGGEAAGFDLAQTTDRPGPAAAPAAAGSPAPSAANSSLGMIKVGNFNTENAADASPLQAAALSFANLCRANEDRVRAMAERYTRAHPIFQQYGQEWMKDPELRKLNDDYMRMHDPVAFLHGLAASKHFGAMVKKYGVNPAFQQFAQEAMKIAPPEAREVAMNYIDQDKVASSVLDNVMQAIGMPPGILGSVSQQAGQAPQIDQNKLFQSVMGAHPELQKAAGSGDADGFKKHLRNPDRQ